MCAVSALSAIASATTFSVTNFVDSGAGSLREAITLANANPGLDTIAFNFSGVGVPPPFGLNLFGPLPTITESLNIVGPGSDILIVRRGDDITTNFNPFNISGTNLSVELSGMTIDRGAELNGAAIRFNGSGTLTIRGCVINRCAASGAGGAIYFRGAGDGTLNFIDSSTIECSAAEAGGSLYLVRDSGRAVLNLTGSSIIRGSIKNTLANKNGAGIYVGGTGGPNAITISASSLIGNGTNDQSSGGAIFLDGIGGTLTITNSTIAGNAAGLGPAMSLQQVTAASILHGTFTQNNALNTPGVGIIRTTGGVLSIKNTIMSGNVAGSAFRDLADGLSASGNNNLIGVGGPFSAGVAGNILGVNNPKLAPLNTIGGMTPVYALRPDSPALDAGSNADAPALDQRGQPRPADGDNNGSTIADIGAFETQKFVVTTINDTGAGSLRAAISANNLAGGGFVRFAIAGTGSLRTIQPLTPMPVIARPVFLDAWSQAGPGVSATPLIELDGSRISAGTGLDLQAPDSIIRGFAINGFAGSTSGANANGIGLAIRSGVGNRNWVYGNYFGLALDGTTLRANAQAGVAIFVNANTNLIGSNGDGVADSAERNVIAGSTAGLRSGVYVQSNTNAIAGNFIGLTADGAAARPNGLGVFLDNGATNNRVGVASSDALPLSGRNVISGNTSHGVLVKSGFGSGNSIAGCFIGLRAAGDQAIGNGGAGVMIDNSPTVLVGGSGPSTGNVISGNQGDGITYSGFDAVGGVVQGNIVGLASNGLTRIGNNGNGLAIRGGASFMRVGTFGDATSDDFARANTFSGNFSRGIDLVDADTQFHQIAGNRIGTSVDGLTAVPNSTAGMRLWNVSHVLIGGTGILSNVISGNNSAPLGNGIELTGAVANIIRGNSIGVAASGAPLANFGIGVFISASSLNNTIGGIEPGEGNTIANCSWGIAVLDAGSVQNSILGNSISSNRNLGIDLAGDGVTANGPSPRNGPNGFQNYPVITSVSSAGELRATLSARANTTYRIELFSSVTPDPTGFGEGTQFLGFVNTLTNQAGDSGPITFNFSPDPLRPFLTSTATELSSSVPTAGLSDTPGTPGNTSEFSLARQINTRPTSTPQSVSTGEDSDVLITLVASDADAGSTLVRRITRLPEVGALLQFGSLTPITTVQTTVSDSSGRVVFRPVANQFAAAYASFDYVVEDGTEPSTASTVNIAVTPTADTPSVTSATTLEGIMTTSGLVISRSAVDGPEVTHFQITGIGNGSLFFNDGLTAIADGQFITAAQGAAGLKFLPTAAFFGSGSFTVRASLSASAPGLGGSSVKASISILPVAGTPSVTSVSTDEDTLTPTPIVFTRATTDGAEVTHVKVLSVSSGGLLAADGVTPIAAGSFVALDSSGQASFTFVPSPNFYGQANVTLRASIGASDVGLGGSIVNSTVTVRPVADTPSITDALTSEATQTSSGLVITRNAVDGVEVTHFQITAILSGTLFQADGVSPISVGQFITTAQASAGLRFTPAPFFSGQASVRVRASLSGAAIGLGGSEATGLISVGAVANQPIVTNASTLEDTQSTSGLVITRNPNDSTEVTHFRISQISGGTLFSADGVTQVNSGGFITAAQGLAGLRFTPSQDSIATGSFRVQASIGASDAGTGPSVAAATISVTPVADTPSITPTTTLEDTTSSTGMIVARALVDGPETTHVKIISVTNGVLMLSDGISLVPAGTFVPMSAANLGFKFRPSANFFGVAAVQIRASSSASDAGLGGAIASASITVQPVADTPTVENTTTLEDTQAKVTFARSSVDAGEVQFVKVISVTGGTLATPSGSTVNVGSFVSLNPLGGGSLVFVPKPDTFGKATVTIRASLSANDAGLGGEPATSSVDVSPVADTPSISNAATFEGIQTSSGLVLARNAVDGAEVTHYRITGITSGRVFLSDGTSEVLEGAFISASQGAAGLRFTPSPGFFGTASLRAQASVNSTPAGLGGSIVPAQIVVTPNAKTPTITNASTLENQPTTAGLVIARSLINGAEVTHFKITSLELGSLQLANTTPVTVGQFITAAQAAAGLRFVPPTDFFGDVRVGVAASLNATDAGIANAPVIGTITVVPVNNAPSFVASTPPTTNEPTAATQITIPGWATFTPGPTNESAQRVQAFIVSNVTNPALFGAPPTVSVDGTLRYTVAPLVFGTSQFTLVVRDDGGTDNSGVDTSTSRTFTITVAAVNQPPSFSASTPTAVLEDSGASTIISWASFSPGPGNESNQTVLAYSVRNITSPALFSAPPTVAVDGTLRYTPAPNAFGTSQFSVTVRDTGGIDLGGTDTSLAQIFSITVTPVNDAPSFAAATLAPVLENCGPVVVSNFASFSPGPSNENTQTTLGYTVSNVTRPSLFAQPPTIGNDGTLRFTPATDISGSSQFTLRVQDSGGLANGGVDTSSSQTFTITVLQVNQAPNFSASNPPAVLEGSGAVSLSGWVTSFTPGPPDEASQGVLAYLVDQVSNPSLFSIPPAINTSGQLTYTLAATGIGTSTFRVRVQDDGGTANLGVDISPPQTFRVVARPAAKAVDVTLDASTACVRPRVTLAAINRTPSDAGPGATQSITTQPSLDNNFPIGSTSVTLRVTYSDGLTSTAQCTVRVIGTDCNGNGIPDTCDIADGITTDCNGDGIPDDCQCVWDNGPAPTGTAIGTANGQLSHLGGAIPLGAKAVDDFYLQPGALYRIFGLSGAMLTNSIPSLRKARLEFYTDCDGMPSLVPFATFNTSRIISTVPAGGGFDLVTYSFDLCTQSFFLDGDKSYWVSIMGITDGQGVDSSYWVTTNPVPNPVGTMGAVPRKALGLLGSGWPNYNWGTWDNIDDCCIGCANLSYSIRGEICPKLWTNGKPDLSETGIGGTLSGTNRGQFPQPRSADNFVIRPCSQTTICYIETTIFTNCNPVVGFVEIYDNQCKRPAGQYLFRGVPDRITPIGRSIVVDGISYPGYKLEFYTQAWTLAPGKTYWISSGAEIQSSLTIRSFFAHASDCQSCGSGIQLSPGQVLRQVPAQTEWVEGAREYAFRIFRRPVASDGFYALPPVTPAATCTADINRDGAVGAQDIFDFLTAWFRGCP